MSRIYRFTHPLRPDTSTCILSDRDDLVDLACYILVKAGGYNGPPFYSQANTKEGVYSLLQALMTKLKRPFDLAHLAHALHHIEALALDYCNQHYLNEPLVLQAGCDVDLWNPTLLDALQRCQQDKHAYEDTILQKLLGLTQRSNRMYFTKETCTLPFLMLIYSNHAHLAKVLEAMEACQLVADLDDDTSVTDVDLQQALKTRKVWQLFPTAENPHCANPAYDAMLLNEPVTTLMDDGFWMAEWQQPDGQAGHKVYGSEHLAGAALHQLSGKR